MTHIRQYFKKHIGFAQSKLALLRTIEKFPKYIYARSNCEQMATAGAAASKARSLHRLFVGNLPWTVGHQELRTYFKEFGRVVSANVVFDKKTGCSKGFGFVAFNNLGALEKIENEQKHILEGNYLNIQKN